MRAGSQCALLIYGIHYHESWGPDVREFKPERWLDPNNAPNPNMFAGFSIGKRACMGMCKFLPLINAVFVDDLIKVTWNRWMLTILVVFVNDLTI